MKEFQCSPTNPYFDEGAKIVDKPKGLKPCIDKAKNLVYSEKHSKTEMFYICLLFRMVFIQ